MPLSGPQLRAAIGLAVFVLLVYVVGLVWLMSQRGATDPAWTRSVFIVNGVEALAFAAAGWLWGTQVNRGAAEVAQKQADQTREDLDRTKDEVSEQSALRVQAERDAAETTQRERSRAAFLAMDHFTTDGAAAGADDPDSGSVSSAGRPVAPGAARPGAAHTRADRLRRFLQELNPEAFVDR